MYLEIKVEVEIGVHEIRSRFTPRPRSSSRRITGHKVLNLIPIKNNINILLLTDAKNYRASLGVPGTGKLLSMAS